MISSTIQNEKNRKKMVHGEKISKTIMAKSSDTTKDVNNRIFLTGDSIVKHVRNCKVYVKSFPGAKVMCMDN